MNSFYQSGACSGCVYGLLLVASCAFVARKFGASVRMAFIIGAGSLLVAWLPMQPHLIGILRGAFGELSAGTLITSLLLMLTVSGRFKPSQTPGLKTCKWLIIVTGSLLYGNYLGWIASGSLAIYEIGFTAGWLPLAVAGFGIFAALKGWLWPSLWMAAALGGWQLDILPTNNLWDYALDAPLWLAACIYQLRQWLTGLRKKDNLGNR